MDSAIDRADQALYQAKEAGGSLHAKPIIWPADAFHLPPWIWSSPHLVPWFRSVAPHIHAHRGKTFVVALSGELIAAGKLESFVQDLALMHAMGIKIVLAHGFRPQLEEQLRAKGHTSHFSDGMRITDPVALDCAQEAAGQLRYESRPPSRWAYRTRPWLARPSA